MTWAETIANNISKEISIEAKRKKIKENLLTTFIAHKLVLINQFNTLYDSVNLYFSNGLSMETNEEKDEYVWKFNTIWLKLEFELANQTSKSLASAKLRVRDTEDGTNNVKTYSYELFLVSDELKWYLNKTDGREDYHEYFDSTQAEELFKKCLKKYL